MDGILVLEDGHFFRGKRFGGEFAESGAHGAGGVSNGVKIILGGFVFLIMTQIIYNLNIRLVKSSGISIIDCWYNYCTNSSFLSRQYCLLIVLIYCNIFI